MILTDTCVLIDYFKGDPEAVKIVDSIGVENILLNSIIVMELISGARDKVELNSLKKRLNEYRILEINQDIMDEAGSLMEDYYLSHGLKIPDAIIAATAKYHDISLLTFNEKDFGFIPGVELYKF